MILLHIEFFLSTTILNPSPVASPAFVTISPALHVSTLSICTRGSHFLIHSLKHLRMSLTGRPCVRPILIFYSHPFRILATSHSFTGTFDYFASPSHYLDSQKSVSFRSSVLNACISFPCWLWSSMLNTVSDNRIVNARSVFPQIRVQILFEKPSKSVGTLKWSRKNVLKSQIHRPRIVRLIENSWRPIQSNKSQGTLEIFARK